MCHLPIREKQRERIVFARNVRQHVALFVQFHCSDGQTVIGGPHLILLGADDLRHPSAIVRAPLIVAEQLLVHPSQVLSRVRKELVVLNHLLQLSARFVDVESADGTDSFVDVLQIRLRSTQRLWHIDRLSVHAMACSQLIDRCRHAFVGLVQPLAHLLVLMALGVGSFLQPNRSSSESVVRQGVPVVVSEVLTQSLHDHGQIG